MSNKQLTSHCQSLSAADIRLYLCDCGLVRVETKHLRLTFTPAEFLTHLRRAAGLDGVGPTPTIPPATACNSKTAARAIQHLLDHRSHAQSAANSQRTEVRGMLPILQPASSALHLPSAEAETRAASKEISR
jgi:hypothetical protein